MSRYHRTAVSAAWIVAVAFLFSSVIPVALADAEGAKRDDSTAKVTKKAKTCKADEKKATSKKGDEKKAADKKAGDKKAGDKKADAEKSKAEKKYEDFDDDEDSAPSKPVAKSEAKPAEKAAGNSVKAKEKSAKEADHSDDSKVFEHKAGGTATATKDAAKKAAKSSATVVRFSLNGEYPEGPSDVGPFTDVQPSLGKLIGRLDEAKTDKQVQAVWLRLEDLELGRGKVNEIRAAIARVRKAGKPVYAELTSADTGAYLVATACDYIYMPVSGVLIVPGVRMEMTFYKGLLDKLGLKFDALRMGKYKGFVEPFSREHMSAPAREPAGDRRRRL